MTKDLIRTIRVLCVDDDAEFAVRMSERLKVAGFAARAESRLGIALAEAADYDLVLSDWQRVAPERPFAAVSFGPLHVDLVGGSVAAAGRDLGLQPLQLRLLALLLQNTGEVVTCEDLRQRVFKTAQQSGSTNIARHVSVLRSQLGEFRHMVVTERGGYSLKVLESALE